MLDLLIRGGTVVDGTGSAPYAADVAVENGKIVEAGDLPDAHARRVISAAGKLVTPGGAVEICRILGKEETLRRLRAGLEKLA